MFILPILNRLYTSVITLNPEISGLKVSWPTDMSPTTIFSLGTDRWVTARMSTGGGRGVPGVWDVVGAWEGYTGTPPAPSQDPYLVYI